MKKSLFSVIISAFFMVPALVFAQYTHPNTYPTYGYGSSYPQYPQQTSNYYTPPSAGCITLTQTLSIGSTGPEVTMLQNFLVSRGLLANVTGYFGTETGIAVRNFQRQQGISVTGVVGQQTRAAIQSVSCASTYTPPPTYPNYTYPGYTYPNYTYPNYTYPGYTPPQYTPPTYCYSGYGYGYGCTTPTINYLNPQAGAVGTSVTIFGSGFSTTGNSVRFGNGVIANLNSSDGRSVSFTVPSQLTGFGSQPVQIGAYPVAVVNAQGASSNSVPFYVTALGNYAAPTIAAVSGPTQLAVSAVGTWALSINTANNPYVTVSVTWGDEGTYPYSFGALPPQTVYANQTATFTHTYIASGNYTITFRVQNQSGQSNSSTATVNVTGSQTGALTLASISPNSGRVGTQVVLLGTGFAPYGNTVRFGVGGTSNLNSFNNGTTIYYTIPAWVSPCDLTQYGYYCGAPVQQVTPGTYQISVSAPTQYGISHGTSNTVSFTVIQ